MRLAVILPDIHHPYHDKACMNAVFSFLKDYGKKLSWLILNGDAMDCETVSHWMKDKARELEGKRVKKDYKSFDEEILTPLENSVSPSCKKVYMIGNHEDWIDQAISKTPALEGYYEVGTNLNFKERGWIEVPLNGSYNLGHLTVLHGLYTNKYHAAKTLDIFGGKSIVYAHTHDKQSHTKVTPLEIKDVHEAVSIGCLCNRNPTYGKNKPNKWVHAFGIVYIMPDGQFNLYVPNIINGKFIWNGKIYGGKK